MSIDFKNLMIQKIYKAKERDIDLLEDTLNNIVINMENLIVILMI